MLASRLLKSPITIIGSGLPIMVMGDFNFPDIQWDIGQTVSMESQDFVIMVGECFLYQYILAPTRGKNTLDLVGLLGTEIDIVDNVTIGCPVGKRAHNLLEFTGYRYHCGKYLEGG